VRAALRSQPRAHFVAAALAEARAALRSPQPCSQAWRRLVPLRSLPRAHSLAVAHAELRAALFLLH